MSYEKVVQDTIDAYKDCNHLASSDANRNLQFLSGEWVPYEIMREAYQKAVPNGYNFFDPGHLKFFEVLGLHGVLEFKSARESSPCLYVRFQNPEREGYTEIKNALEDPVYGIDPDEIMVVEDTIIEYDWDEGHEHHDFGEKVLRLWWD